MSQDILSMSDEEIEALGPSPYDKLPQPTVEEQPAQEPEVEQEEVEQPAEEPEQVEQPAPTEEEEEQPQEEEQEEEVKPAPAPAPHAQQPTEEVKPVTEPKQTQAKAPAAKTDEPAKEATDAEAQLAKLFSTFKASGRDFQVSSVEEAIQLMQKGVNYHDKMHGLKPVLSITRMLEREGLLDEGKLAYLIDLHKKNPEAIAKLVKDSGVDTLDVDDKKVAEYKPKDYRLSDSENALEDALSDLRQYSSHDRVVSLVNTRLDNESKQLVLKNPHVLLHIAAQIDSGVYDVVQAEVDKQRIMGNLRGVSDLQAYDVVGKALAERGAFNHLNKPAEPKAPVVVAPKKPVVDPARAAAKAAAAPSTTSKAGKEKEKDFNPLALSDSEFEEFMAKAGKR